LCLLLGKLPGELTIDKVSFEEVALMLRVYDEEQREERKKLIDEIGFILGTTWDVGSDEEDKLAKQSPKRKQNTVVVPLAYAIGYGGMSGIKPFIKTVEELKHKARLANKGFESATDRTNRLSKKEYLNIFGRK